MLIVAALGRSALSFEADAQASERRIARIAQALAPLADAHQLVIAHGLGVAPGQTAAIRRADLDAARNAGVVGHLLARELRNARPDANIGTVMAQAVVLDGSRLPGAGAPGEAATCRILELPLLRHWAERDGVVLCVGCVPVCQDAAGRFIGSSAALDLDEVATAMAMELEADILLLLTDVAGVCADGPARGPVVRQIGATTPLDPSLDPKTIGAKVRAAQHFARRPYTTAVIGSAEDAEALVAGRAGTRVTGATL